MKSEYQIKKRIKKIKDDVNKLREDSLNNLDKKWVVESNADTIRLYEHGWISSLEWVLRKGEFK